MNPDYYRLLKNKRWYAKRKAILQRDGNKCTVCGSEKKLRIHHTFYFSNYPKPWEYPDESLITVCDECHKKYHEYHEIEIRKARPKCKLKTKKIKRKKNKLVQKVPKRILTKVKHGRFHIYELKTINNK